MIEFNLGGVPFQALNGGSSFERSAAVSISVSTKKQEETYRQCGALTANRDSEGNFACLKDKFGVSWQIVLTVLPESLGFYDSEVEARVMQVMGGMSKIIFSELDAAFSG